MKKLLIGLLLSSFTFAGGMGNGGHPYEIAFKEDGIKVLNILLDEKIEKTKALSEIDLYNLEMDIMNATLEIKKKKLKDKFGRIKCARNFPGKKLIQFNKKCWENIKDNKVLRAQFVLHEYLGLSGQEVDHYNITKDLRFIFKKELETKTMTVMEVFEAMRDNKFANCFISKEKFYSYVYKFSHKGEIIDTASNVQGFGGADIKRLMIKAYSYYEEGKCRLVKKDAL